MSLSAAHKNDFVKGYKDTVNMLGTPFNLAKPDGTAAGMITAHFVPTNNNDSTLIGSLGYEGRILHTLETPVIEKYDVVTSPSGKQYAVHAVHEIFVNEILVGQKLIVQS